MNYFSSMVFLLFISSVLHSQTHNWTRTNPGGGGAYSTVGASASGIVIAGSDLSGAYRSKDRGQTWDVIGASNGLTVTHIGGVGFHRTNGNIIYIGTNQGLFRSDNGGNTVTNVLDNGYITDIEFGTDDPNKGYASHHPLFEPLKGTIYKSDDNGLSWSQISNNIPVGHRILKIVVNPSDSEIVYILTGSGRFGCGIADVFKSTDGGAQWTNLTPNLKEVLDIAIDPNQPETIYITTMNANCSAQFYWTDLIGNLYKSTNGGTTWGAPVSDYTGVLWIDKNNANTLRIIDPREPYTWTDRPGTYISTNGGSTFTSTGGVNNWGLFFGYDALHAYGTSYNGICKTIGEDLSDDNTYYWVNPQWVFKTSDYGKTFANTFTDEISSGFWQSRGFDNVNMMDISISEADPNIIFTSLFDIGIYRSLDRGESWQNVNDVAHSGGWDGFGGNSATVITDPERSNVVWASLGGEQNGQSPTFLLRNIETGQKDKWTEVSGLPDTEIMGLSIDKKSPKDNRTLFVTANADVYKSTDDGKTWSLSFDCGGCRFTAVDQFDGNIVYSGGEVGLWKTINGGSNWTNVSHSEMIINNDAEFWNRNYAGIFDVKTDPNHANWVYVTVLGANRGLYKSMSNGTNWEKLLTDDFMRKVAIVSQNSNVIYATSSSAFEEGGYDENSNGIWFSDKGGQAGSWTQQNQGMAYPFALAVAVDNTSTPTVFVGSPGTGFQKSSVPLASLPVEDFEASKIDVKIYPNPFTNKLTINYSSSEYNVKIINYLGQELAKFSNINGEITIPLSSLEKGFYFVQIFNEQKKYLTTQKIIKY